MKIIVTGGAGFIGSHVVEKLMAEEQKQEQKHEIVVRVIDNLSTGDVAFIKPFFDEEHFLFHNVDLLNGDIAGFFQGVEEVWHLAANSDVRIGVENTKVPLEQNVIATYKVLEAMRKNEVKRIIFSSSSTIYGEAKRIPTPEDYGPLMPISLYGASKLACEALIASYCHTFDMEAWIYRFANVIGKRSGHGVIFDFINKLRKNQKELEILGDGYQTKSYVYIDDCIDAMFFGLKARGRGKVNIFNIGTEDTIRVREIAEIVCEEMGFSPLFKFTEGKRGWKGDVSTMLLDASRLKGLGWKQRYNSKEAVRKATRDLLDHA